MEFINPRWLGRALSNVRPLRNPYGSTPVVIVGGGVIGLCCAYSLRRRGVEVIVIERDRIGQGCSLGNGGWLCPVDCRPLPEPGVPRFAMRSLVSRDSAVHFKASTLPGLAPWIARFWLNCNETAYQRGLEALARLAKPTFELIDAMKADGVEFELHRQGMIYATRDPKDAHIALERLQPMRRHGYKIPDELILGSDLHALEPALADEIRAGFLVEEFWHLRPESFVQGLQRVLRAEGVAFLEGTTVTGFSLENGQVRAVRTSSGEIEGAAFLLSAGAVTGQLSAKLGVHLPLQAGKGYSFHIKPNVPLRHAIDLPDIHVGCSPFGEEVRISGTMEFSGFNTRLDRARINTVVRGARASLRDWIDPQIDSVWAGMRPVTSDGLPVLDRASSLGNLFIATGHAMQGVHLSAVTGEHMAELMVTGNRPPVLEPFRIDRFRHLRKRPGPATRLTS
jgi:D-amino-acid dehydrogenase